jgi:hypothetical protein
MSRITIRSIEEFITAVRRESVECSHAWFRGEPGNTSTALLPKVYRPRSDGSQHNENRLLQNFRMKAPIFAGSSCPCPDRTAVDQWLFLAQHVGLPTRLLDWSASALVGLYFGLLQERPVVWMLDPIKLNQKSQSGESLIEQDLIDADFPLTWFKPEGAINIGAENIRGAWQRDKKGVQLPVAVQPTNIHPRMSGQRSCFPVQGRDKRSLCDQVPALLRRFDIEPSSRDRLQRDLRLLGISHSTVWPDLDGLAVELAELY